ncbi:hypothetical protein Vadar_032863 [Vaccinium darrowii]|uniref:Uncharacterized protein n=1 Tax=Vaccinium darrowii TaxID=229202 RepID=A0ACB7Z0U1_9ERIC|nr:hypothetical protein Vadar_032863 [Vaccinium darrowii]
MADPQSVKADNDFSNRRMTRSAFKRPFGYLEKYPEEKKLRSKQKAGGLSKTDDNQQQQHMEGKDGTEVRKSLTGKAQREQLRERRKRWRKLTTEEAERYSKKVMESEGFDVVDLPDYIENCGLIKPVKNLSEEQGVIEKCSKSAIATFNKQHRTKYRFVELIRANYKLGSSIYYYITFVAEDKDAGTNNFQALVGSLFKRATVKFCRLEKPPNEGVKYKFTYVMEEEDPNKPKKPLPALFWFMLEFKKKFKEKYPNPPRNAAGRAAGVAWKSMSEAEKAPYVEIAEKKMAEYDKNLEAYNKRLADGRVEEEESDKLTSKVNDEDEDDEGVVGL